MFGELKLLFDTNLVISDILFEIRFTLDFFFWEDGPISGHYLNFSPFLYDEWEWIFIKIKKIGSIHLEGGGCQQTKIGEVPIPLHIELFTN